MRTEHTFEIWRYTWLKVGFCAKIKHLVNPSPPPPYTPLHPSPSRSSFFFYFAFQGSSSVLFVCQWFHLWRILSLFVPRLSFRLLLSRESSAPWLSHFLGIFTILFCCLKRKCQSIQWTLVITTSFVSKDVAIKMNLLLKRILNVQNDM